MKFHQIVPETTNINFIGKFKYFLAFSVITLILIIYGLLTKGLNFGIDFTGGTVMQVKFNEPRKTEDVRQMVDSMGHVDATVVGLGTSGQEYLITAREIHQEN